MKRFFAVAAAAAAIAGATQAHATDFVLTSDVGNTTQAKHFYIDSATATTVNANLSNTVNAGSFTDYYFFAPLVAFSVGDGSTTSSKSNFEFGVGSGVDAIEVTQFSLASLDAATLAAFNDAFTVTGGAAAATQYLNDSLAVGNWTRVAANAALGTVVATASTDVGNLRQAHIDGLPLFGGNFYMITVKGKAGFAQSNYTGTLNSTTVPEPATWALMLVGFGAVGFAMRRGRKEQAKVRFAF